MTVPPIQSKACREALALVLKTAQAAEASRDVESAMAALNACWFAINDAQTSLNHARAEARVAAWEATLGVHA